MAKIFRKTHNPYVLCAVTHNLTLIQAVGRRQQNSVLESADSCKNQLTLVPILTLILAKLVCGYGPYPHYHGSSIALLTHLVYVGLVYIPLVYISIYTIRRLMT